MRDDRRRLLFTNCTVWTGEIGSAARREVLVEGTTIAAVAPRIDEQRRRGAVMIDCADATLIPGLVDGHSHLSFLEKPNIVEIGFVPVEEHTLETMHNAYRVLLGGFTSCVGASSAKARLDIVIRNEINAGRIPGPRLLASTPEITVTGGLGDERLLHMYRESVAVVIDGADEIREYVRTMCREGCDIIKLNISGNQTLANAPSTATLMTEAEIEAAVTTAHAYGKRVMSHARSSASVQLSLKHGIDFINHTIPSMRRRPGALRPRRLRRWGCPDRVENCAKVYRSCGVAACACWSAATTDLHGRRMAPMLAICITS